MTIVVHDPSLAEVPADLLARWRRIPVAVAADLAPERQIDPAIRPLRPPGGQPALFGRAVTVRCDPPDFGGVLVNEVTPTAVRITPPLVITDEEIDEALARLGAALDAI